MRTRLIVAFIVVALLINPMPVQHLFYSRKPGQMYAPTPPAALALCLITAGLLLAVIAGLAFVASRRVLPVRRLAKAAQRTDIAIAVASCPQVRNLAGVHTDVPAGLTVPLDRRRFDVIVANLVSNALCHGERPVTVRAGIWPGERGGRELVLEVRDHGPGLPASAIPRVFERFYKADTARSRSDGSGLGLALAWENARLHGGRIDVSSHLWPAIRGARCGVLAGAQYHDPRTWKGKQADLLKKVIGAGASDGSPTLQYSSA